MKIDFNQPNNDPLIAAEIRKMYKAAELMGIDTSDPELMGAFFQALKKKISAGIGNLKKSFTGGGKPKAITVQTEKGTVSLSPSGATWTDAAQPSLPVSAASGINQTVSNLMKNPIAIAAAIGIPLLLLKRGKR